MIIKTKLLQDSCKKILSAVDNGTNYKVSETIELETKDNILYLNVTNKEYYVSVKITLDTPSTLHAVVDAKLFLSLISKLSTTEVELLTTDKTLNIKWSGGHYSSPLIQDNNGEMIKLPKIDIINVTSCFNINNGVLQSILKYNSKELLKTGSDSAVQNLFYVDDSGAITFSRYGACVNSFKLEQPVTLFLPDKVIKLFKLFTEDVSFTIGHDEINGHIVTKVSFTTDDVSLTSIINLDNTITSAFPIDAIRAMVNTACDYEVNISKSDLLDSINRLLVFYSKSEVPYIYITLSNEKLTLSDSRKINSEDIYYTSSSLSLESDYQALFNATDFKLTLESCAETHISLSFGNHRAVVISKGNIKSVVSECNL